MNKKESVSQKLKKFRTLVLMKLRESLQFQCPVCENRFSFKSAYCEEGKQLPADVLPFGAVGQVRS